MTIRVLLRDYPHRAIALATSDYALIFRHTSTDNNASASSLSLSTTNTGNNASTASTSAPRCMVEFSALDSVDLAEYRSLSTLSAQGTLGLITLGRDVFLCVVNGSTKVASVRLGESVYRISSVEFRELDLFSKAILTHVLGTLLLNLWQAIRRWNQKILSAWWTLSRRLHCSSPLEGEEVPAGVRSAGCYACYFRTHRSGLQQLGKAAD